MTEDLPLRFIGVAPLLMHAGRLADPFDTFAKALRRLTSKRMKTEADHQAIARTEWYGGLWLHDRSPCLPAEAVEACLVDAAKSRRAGTLVRSAVTVRESAVLQHPGPKGLDQLFADPAHVMRCSVRVNGRRTTRTRPQFPEWSADVTINFLPSTIERSALFEIACIAGDAVGIGDYRPKYGRFRVEHR